MKVNEEVRGEVVGEETLWCTVRVSFAAAAAASAAAGEIRIEIADRQLQRRLLLLRSVRMTSSATSPLARVDAPPAHVSGDVVGSSRRRNEGTFAKRSVVGAQSSSGPPTELAW